MEHFIDGFLSTFRILINNIQLFYVSVNWNNVFRFAGQSLAVFIIILVVTFIGVKIENYLNKL